MRRPNEQREGDEWLKEVVKSFKHAVQAEDMQAPVENAVLTPNSALLHLGGKKITVKWLKGKRTDLMTGYGVEIIRITPMAGRIAVALKRPKRGILHLSEVWARRKLEPSAPTKNMALVVGEQEDDGALFYLSLEGDFEGQEEAAPHTLVSGTTGSGKGILVSNLTLVAITGGKHVENPDAVITRLEKTKAKYDDMVLVHGGGPGVERVAAQWPNGTQCTKWCASRTGTHTDGPHRSGETTSC